MSQELMRFLGFGRLIRFPALLDLQASAGASSSSRSSCTITDPSHEGYSHTSIVVSQVWQSDRLEERKGCHDITRSMATPKFEFEVPSAQHCVLSFPERGVLLVRLNRPKDLNCINSTGHAELDRIWSWLDVEPTLSVGIITGTGRAFCAGADLKEWNTSNSSGQPRNPMPSSGFAALSRRTGRKPIIAAVNGLAYGGGTEIIVNCDLVVAAKKATFSLPEVKRGVVAMAGALPRIIRTIGRPRATEMALTGRVVSADEAREWGLINKVVGDRDGEVVEAALKYARAIADNSPDAVIVSREGLKLGWDSLGAEEGSRMLMETWFPRLQAGENIREGLQAFVEKRKPKWKPAKL